jgi:hypothetical protein
MQTSIDMPTINIAYDFSMFPGLRNSELSEDSGEDFYHRILNKSFAEALADGGKLVVVLDGTDGYASSFLDEAFGNLVYDFSSSTVKKHLEIISEQEPHWKDMIINKTFVEWESRRKQKEEPKVTKLHSPWARLVGNEIKYQVWKAPGN